MNHYLATDGASSENHITIKSSGIPVIRATDRVYDLQCKPHRVYGLSASDSTYGTRLFVTTSDAMKNLGIDLGINFKFGRRPSRNYGRRLQYPDHGNGTREAMKSRMRLAESDLRRTMLDLGFFPSIEDLTNHVNHIHELMTGGKK